MASVHQFDADPGLSITTLGAALVVAGKDRGPSARTLGPGKPLALLVYLAFSPGRAATRDALVDLLWSDVEREDGRHALRQTIWYIKKNLGERAIVASRDVVRIAAAVEADREEFLAAIDRQQFEDAISLYRGDFFPDFAQPGAIEFEHWAELERQRLRSVFLRAGQSVVRAWLSIARHKDAIKLARRLRDTERSETNWRLVLECLVAGRDQLGATLEADALQQHIASEEREPEPATRSMLRLVHQTPHESMGASATGLVAALVGRETEFATLAAAWDRTRERGSQHVHVVGAAGLGKTRLLGDFGARLRSQRARVATVNARPGERLIPYALASEVVGSLAQLAGAAGVGEATAASLVALNPSLSASFAASPDGAQGDEALRRRTIAVRDLIETIADERPVALIVDDWHWVDEVSQRLLNSALQRFAGERVLFVTAGRPGYASPEGPHTMRVTLSALSTSEVAEVIASVGQLPDEAWSDQLTRAVHTASGGSPLLVMETIQWLIDRGVASLESAQWRLHDVQGLAGIGSSGSAIRERLSSLDDGDRDVVNLISVAGVPLSLSTLAHALDANGTNLVARLDRLEHRGFVARVGDAWSVAHDVIAEAAVALLPAEGRRHLERRLGVSRSSSSDGDASVLLQAGRHFMRAGDIPQAASVFGRWFRHMRREDDERSVHRLAEEFAGPDATRSQTSEIARAVPIPRRITRGQQRVAAAALVVVTLVAAIVMLRPAFQTLPAPDGVLLVSYVNAVGDTVATPIELRASEIKQNDVIDVGALPSERRSVPVNRGPRALSPDGRTWVTHEAVSDSGGLELIAIDVTTGRQTRLTRSRADDVSPSWSPRGDAIVFASGRFDAREHNKIAILTVATGVVQQLTRGNETDSDPVWSPRADRVAFSRRYWTVDRPADLCFIASDGGDEVCHTLPGIAVPLPVAWYDGDRVIVLPGLRFGGNAGIVVFDANTKRVEWIYRGEVSELQPSPDGQMLACVCSEDARLPARWRVFSVNNPGVATEIVRGRVTNDPIALQWISPSARRIYFERLAIESQTDVLPLGIPFQLDAVGFEAGGRMVTPPSIRWRSRNPAVATIDSSGTVTPRRAGRVVIEASSGGRVSTERAFTVAPATSDRLLRLSWSSFADSAIIAFGDPKPLLDSDPMLGRVLVINGDSSFTSGVMTSQPLDARHGLGIEAIVSARIDDTQWQSIGVGFDGAVNPQGLAQWDRTTGGVPRRVSDYSVCAAGYPAGEGPASVGHISIGGGLRIPLPRELSRGRPFRLRVQIFPDGRCGLAIDGKPKLVLTVRRPRDSRYHAYIAGYSHRTRILVGQTEVWSGVRGDVDWGSLFPPSR